ncbi:unnamed protein product, partial [Mesorhabditis belari]
MSPSIFESLENMPPTPETPCSTSFSWSIEQMALLNPAEITDVEIANSAFSPDPALEAQYRAAADIYWNSGVLYVPSPEGPGPMLVSKTPLADVVRLRAARLAAAAGSMSKAQVETPVCKTSKKRRSSSLRSGAQGQKRHCGTQTACTISPNIDFDFAAILGEASVFHDVQVDAGEEFEPNSSIGSLRRRLFAEDDDSCLSDSPNQDLTKSHLKVDLDGNSFITSPENYFPSLSPICPKDEL